MTQRGDKGREHSLFAMSGSAATAGPERPNGAFDLPEPDKIETAARGLRGGLRGYVLRRILAVGDLLALVLAFAGMVGIRVMIGREPAIAIEPELFAAMLPVWVALATAFKTYHVGDRSLDYSLTDEVGPVFLVATVWNWILLIATAAFRVGSVEVMPAVVLWIASIFLVLSFRAIAVWAARHRRWYRQKVLVVGSPVDSARVVRRIERHPEYGLELVGTAALADNGRRDLPAIGLEENERFGTVVDQPADVVALADELGASRAIVATAPGNLEDRSELIRGLIEAQVQVDLVSGEPDLCSSGAAALHYVEGLPLLTVPSVQVPDTWRAVKRFIDVSASLAGMAILSPFLAFVALVILLDSPGPVLFKQRRIGREGIPFELLKFRTMVDGADEMKVGVAGLNMHAVGDPERRMFKVPRDPRLTRVGAWLRRWSLDELPQLWNVLRGDMSLVGPRPLIPEEAELVEGRYEVRLRMRPGITGPWQTLGRSDIGFEDMVKLDYTYVMNWTLAEDVKLLMRTVGAVVRARGAY